MKKLYEYSELSNEAKRRVFDWYLEREWSTDTVFTWVEDVIHDVNIDATDIHVTIGEDVSSMTVYGLYELSSEMYRILGRQEDFDACLHNIHAIQESVPTTYIPFTIAVNHDDKGSGCDVAFFGQYADWVISRTKAVTGVTIEKDFMTALLVAYQDGLADIKSVLEKHTSKDDILSDMEEYISLNFYMFDEDGVCVGSFC